MVNLNIIKDLAEAKNMPLTELASKVGVSVNQIHLMCRTNSTKVATLEKISEVLGVQPSIFFDEEAARMELFKAKGKQPIAAKNIGKVVNGNTTYKDHARHEEIELYGIPEKVDEEVVSAFGEKSGLIHHSGAGKHSISHEVEKLRLENSLLREQLDEKERLIIEKDKRIADKEELIQTLKTNLQKTL